MPFGFLKTGRAPHRSWTYSASTYIWRVLPTPDGLLIGEERDPAARTASYFCVDAGDGRVLWHREVLGDGWWTGFAASAQGVLLLHGYASPDLPQHLKIFAVDARTGKSLWNNLQVEYAGLHGTDVYATTPAGAAAVMDLHTGRPLPVPAETPPMEMPDDRMLFPEPAELNGSSSIPALRELLGAEPVGPVELLAVGGYLTVVYCTRAGAGADASCTQTIAVIDPQRRKVIHSDRLLARTAAPLPDTCFAREGMLYYIRERRHLVGVRLSAPPAH